MVICCEADDILAIDVIPIRQVFDTDRARPTVMILVKGFDLNLLSVFAIDQVIIVDVNKLNIEAIGCACDHLINLSVFDNLSSGQRGANLTRGHYQVERGANDISELWT